MAESDTSTPPPCGSGGPVGQELVPAQGAQSEEKAGPRQQTI